MNLHWWHDLITARIKREYHWGNYNVYLPDDYNLELIERIKEYPLSSKLVKEFVDNHIEKLDWDNSVLNRTRIRIADSFGKFNIFISKTVDEEEKAEGLTHEIAHGIYRAGDFYQDIIQKEALRFYSNNRYFMKTLLRKNLVH